MLRGMLSADPSCGRVDPRGLCDAFPGALAGVCAAACRGGIKQKEEPTREHPTASRHAPLQDVKQKKGEPVHAPLQTTVRAASRFMSGTLLRKKR
jgi:hypothetical protein